MKNFELSVRAIIVKQGKILLCQVIGKKWFFLPGGHIEFGEKAEVALNREIQEECKVSAKSQRFIGAVENVFTEKGKKHHELNLVFKVKLQNTRVLALEGHLTFHWIDTKKLAELRVLPIALKKSLIHWFEDRKIFWSSQM